MPITRYCLRCNSSVTYHVEHETEGVICQRCGAWVIPPARRVKREWLTPEEAEEETPNYPKVLRKLFATMGLVGLVCLGLPQCLMPDIWPDRQSSPPFATQFVFWIWVTYYVTGIAMPFCLARACWSLSQGDLKSGKFWVESCRVVAGGWALLLFVVVAFTLPFLAWR